jgi:CDP-diacylglycerol--glycerol-3-phosphate 3-phosphatidyltransferase
MDAKAAFRSEILTGLRLRWASIGLLSAALLGGEYAWLAAAWSPIYAQRWLALSALAAGSLLWVFWQNLSDNHPPDAPQLLYGDLGLPNLVTYWRGMMIACTAGFVLIPRPPADLIWLPGLQFSLGILPDYLDGYLARLTGRTTSLGETLDVSVDGVAVLAGTLLVVRYQLVPAWYLLVGFARYLFLLGIWVRRRLKKPVYDLPPSMIRRALAGTQMGFNMVVLWPVFGPPFTTLAAYLFSIPFLYNFTRDWLFVSGALNVQTASNSTLPDVVRRWLPLSLRVGVACGLGIYSATWVGNFAAQTVYLQNLGANNPILLTGLVLALQIGVLMLILLGIMTRTMAVLALCIAGFHLQFSDGMLVIDLLTATCAGLLFFLGSGTLAFWSPEEEILHRRAGESG